MCAILRRHARSQAVHAQPRSTTRAPSHSGLEYGAARTRLMNCTPMRATVAFGTPLVVTATPLRRRLRRFPEET